MILIFLIYAKLAKGVARHNYARASPTHIQWPATALIENPGQYPQTPFTLAGCATSDASYQHPAAAAVRVHLAGPPSSKKRRSPDPGNAPGSSSRRRVSEGLPQGANARVLQRGSSAGAGANQ